MRYSIMSVQDHYPGRGRSVPEFYAEVMAQGERADALGYDTFFLAEHHFHEYGAVPDPSVFLASLAQRTRRLRLGTSISVLTFRNPLTVAETYTMVDILSGGRLVLGVGSGYLQHEFEGFRIDPAEKRDRFDEALFVLTKALSGERFSFHGKYHTVDNVAINVTPLQAPTPPIYVATLRREGAYHIGTKGQKMVCVPYASVDGFEEIGAIVNEFRKGQREARIEPNDEDVLVALHAHVALDDSEARVHAAAPFDLYVASRLYAKRQTYDDVLRTGLSLIGGVETVTQKMQLLQDMGVHHVLAMHNFGMMPQHQVMASMDRFAAIAQRMNEKSDRTGKVTCKVA